MVDITVTRESTASPQAVLDSLRESDPGRRGEVWSNVRPEHFEVHAAGPDFLEVTEGTMVVGLFWERTRYQWTQPDRVTATVLESNVFQPGSTFEVSAVPGADGTTQVEMTLRRRFQRGPKGRIASTVNHLGGRRMFGWYLGTALKAVEKRESR